MIRFDKACAFRPKPPRVPVPRIGASAAHARVREERALAPRMSFQQMIGPADCCLVLIDFQPAMFQGVQSHDRKVIVDTVQVLAKAAKLFGVPTIITTAAKAM